MARSITVEDLSKHYLIGELHRETMFREVLVNFIKQPFRKKQKDSIWALRDVSFAIEKGEALGIIGRNGAGKSTLLKVLSKITYPTSGRIKVCGQVASLLEVGTGFHEELTGRENIYLNGSILGMTKKDIVARLDAIIEFAGVEKFVDTPVKRYSSGMRLRLGFAVAAHLDADVLLVDEVLAVGDVEFQKKCLRAMGDLGSGGRTVLFVSHNMAAIENLCSRVIWIDDGGIRQDGDAREVIRAYLASFAGVQATGINLHDLKTRRGSGDIRYTGIKFLGHDRQPLSVLRSGDNVIMRFYYHAEKRILNPHFSLRIHTDLGTLVSATGTWSTGVQIPFLRPGDGYIDLEIDFINLMPASYYMSLWLASQSTVYDVLEHCAILDIETSNFYGTGKGVESRLGIVFFPCRWKLNGS